jgi:hypothetical protein
LHAQHQLDIDAHKTMFMAFTTLAYTYLITHTWTFTGTLASNKPRLHSPHPKMLPWRVTESAAHKQATCTNLVGKLSSACRIRWAILSYMGWMTRSERHESCRPWIDNTRRCGRHPPVGVVAASCQARDEMIAPVANTFCASILLRYAAAPRDALVRCNCARRFEH